jgi:hypothetical protein
MQMNNEETLLESMPTSRFLNTKEQESFKKALASSLCLKRLLMIEFKKEMMREKKEKH